MVGSDGGMLFDSASDPPWAGFRYSHVDPQCPRCKSRDHFRPPTKWYSLPPENVLIIRCGFCSLDTITTVGALASGLEDEHLGRHGYLRKTVSTERAYSAFVAGMAVGAVGVFILVCL
jgi:hypothetical protein